MTTTTCARRATFADSEDGITIGYTNGLDWPLLVKYYGNRAIFIPQRIFQVSMPKPLRLAEQYLIRAEAYCRQANPRVDLAQKDLEALRATRFQSGGVINLTGNWETDVKTFSEERVRELYMEGFRLQDLKRWGLGFRTHAAVLHPGRGQQPAHRGRRPALRMAHSPARAGGSGLGDHPPTKATSSNHIADRS